MTARSQVGAYVQLPDFITDSEEYKSLTYGARAVLVELLKTINKDGNGAMTLTAKQAGSAWISLRTRSKGLDELQKAGIIVCTQKHSFPHHPDRFAIFWRDWAVKNGVLVSMSHEEFEAWRLKELRHFRQYAVGKVPIFEGISDGGEKTPMVETTTVDW